MHALMNEAEWLPGDEEFTRNWRLQLMKSQHTLWRNTESPSPIVDVAAGPWRLAAMHQPKTLQFAGMLWC